MPETFNYELWNGKEVVGYYKTLTKLCGLYVDIYTDATLKQEYGRQSKPIRVPIAFRIVHDDGVEVLGRWVLDVRRKSKKQIAHIQGIDNQWK